MGKKRKKLYEGKIPFDGDTGNALSQVWVEDPGVDWRDNTVFKMRWEFAGFQQGRSSVTVKLRAPTGPRGTYATTEMFLSDFEDLFTASRFDGRFVEGKWAYAKRGQNYGMIPIEESLDENLHDI